jgi:glycosyltransferase involved in cell wall biosynthesis
MAPRYIVMLDPIGIFQNHQNELVERQYLYLNAFNEATNSKYKLIILSRGDHPSIKGDLLEVVYLPGKNRFSATYFIRLLENLYKIRNRLALILCGDIWESTILALISKIVLRRSIPIQSQIHADIGDENWYKGSLIRKLRLAVIPLYLNNINGIRFVSNGQQERFLKRFNWSGSSLVSPVPSNCITKGNNLNKHKLPNAVGFFGRIHSDRGLNEFVRICKVLTEHDSGIGIIVAGEGPEKNEFIHELRNFTSNVEYLGFLNGDSSSLFWEKVGVLINTAPSESYGRAMREAICNSIPVLALSSPEAMSLRCQLGEKGIEIFSYQDMDVYKKYVNLRNSEINQVAIGKIREEQLESIKKLAKSWHELVGE